MNGYKIVFEDSAPYEYKFEVLQAIIQLYNRGNFSLSVAAEMTLSICMRCEDTKTAKFIYVGM